MSNADGLLETSASTRHMSLWIIMYTLLLGAVVSLHTCKWFTQAEHSYMTGRTSCSNTTGGVYLRLQLLDFRHELQ